MATDGSSCVEVAEPHPSTTRTTSASSPPDKNRSIRQVLLESVECINARRRQVDLQPTVGGGGDRSWAPCLVPVVTRTRSRVNDLTSNSLEPLHQFPIDHH